MPEIQERLDVSGMWKIVGDFFFKENNIILIRQIDDKVIATFLDGVPCPMGSVIETFFEAQYQQTDLLTGTITICTEPRIGIPCDHAPLDDYDLDLTIIDKDHLFGHWTNDLFNNRNCQFGSTHREELSLVRLTAPCDEDTKRNFNKQIRDEQEVLTKWKRDFEDHISTLNKIAQDIESRQKADVSVEKAIATLGASILALSKIAPAVGGSVAAVATTAPQVLAQGMATGLAIAVTGISAGTAVDVVGSEYVQAKGAAATRRVINGISIFAQRSYEDMKADLSALDEITNMLAQGKPCDQVLERLVKIIDELNNKRYKTITTHLKHYYDSIEGDLPGMNLPFIPKWFDGLKDQL